MASRAKSVHVEHGFGPLVEPDSTILILGSFPSVLSREKAFYYANPRNRFWDVLSKAFCDNVPQSVDDKIQFCKRHHIALYDAIESCDVIGSQDTSISNVKPANISQILCKSSVNLIILNGNAAKKYFLKFNQDMTNIPVISLPSTSPANAAWSLERLVETWSKALLGNR